MIFTQSRGINTGMCDLYDRGLGAYMSLKTKLEQLLRHNIPNTMKDKAFHSNGQVKTSYENAIQEELILPKQTR